MGLIANSKIGDCTCCPATNVACRKRGKDLICLSCCKAIDTKKQITKANERNKVRALVTYQKVEGIVDSIQELTIDLDRVTSRMVRLAAMGKDGKVECFTCNAKKDFKVIQCGHFIPRVNNQFRFDWTYNLRPQCKFCNVDLRGNLKAFAERLNAERPGIVEWMEQEARQVYSPTKDELKQLLFDYQQRLNLLETKLK